MMRVQKIGAAAVLLGFLLATVLLNRPATTLITGHVYSELNDQLGPSGPVASAVVSNDWDSTTTTTDADGSFQLPLTKRVAADEFVVVTVRTDNVVVRHQMLGALHKNVQIVLPTARRDR